MPEKDPLWLTFPRWIDESGIPRVIVSQAGIEGWVLFRKFVELDCDVNLTPDWFTYTRDDLIRWTGLDLSRIEWSLSQLEELGWIDRRDPDTPAPQGKIIIPLPVEIDEADVRRRLAGDGGRGGKFVLRYSEDIAGMEKIERVVYLYQMLFGARFSPRIAEDLEEIANSFDMALIYQVFSEAFRKKAKTLAWIKSHLHKSIQEETSDE